MAPSLPSSLTGCGEDDKHKCEGWAFGTKKFTGCWIMSCWRNRELVNKHMTKSSTICAIDDEVMDIHCLFQQELSFWRLCQIPSTQN